MYRKYIDDIRDAYSRWINRLADIISDAMNYADRWNMMVFSTSDKLDIYLKKSGKLKLIGSVSSKGDEGEISSLRRRLAREKSSDRSKCLIRLSSDNVLQKQLPLPKGAGDIIRPVLQNQMMKIAPWPEEETCFNYQILNEEDDNENLEVKVVAASKSTIDETVSKLEQLGLTPSTVDYKEIADLETGLKLQARGLDARTAIATTINRSLAIIFLLCISTAAFGSFLLYTSVNERQTVEARLNTMRQHIARLNRQNAETEKLRKQRSELTSRKAAEPPAVLVLNEVTKALPDGAWLTRLEMRGNEVVLAGRAANAADLIKKLEASSLLDNVRFSAPTTRSPNVNIDTFSILARLLPISRNTEKGAR